MSAFHHFSPFALHGQHLNVGQVLMGSIQAGNGGFVSENSHLVSCDIYKQRRSAALAEWQSVMA